ncbi:unnamed protein product [Brachionus calyciflorus]|uniref:Uncharacterized protein n=1 Tax=Brachionus calyciflorus TaxID=104777 RepID=A0A814DX42_9BILA|nr:unnamed protein product [Brachionus calyciflorus]
MKSQHDKSHKIKSILKPFRLKRKIVKKSIDNYQYYPYNHYHYSNHNPYSYHHVPYHPKHHSSSNEYINFKLSDLIRPNKSFIDNLYAQINSNSNKINLLYIPMVKNNSTVSDQVLYSNPYRRFNLVSLSSNDSNDSNTILNDFFLSASNLERVNKPFSTMRDLTLVIIQ